VVAGCCETPCH